MKLDLKDTDLFGHQIKNTRRAKLLHLKYFNHSFKILALQPHLGNKFQFKTMSIFSGFLIKMLRKYEINFLFPQS
jgi:hypothetical protein